MTYNSNDTGYIRLEGSYHGCIAIDSIYVLNKECRSAAIFVGAIGGVAGMICAGVFTWLQTSVGVVCLNGGESFSDIQYFPIAAWWGDYALTSLTVFGISVLAGIVPSFKAANTNIVVSLRK